MADLKSTFQYSLAPYAEVSRRAFFETGWPSRKNESWHYSDLNRFLPIQQVKNNFINIAKYIDSKEPLSQKIQKALELLKDEFGTSVDFTIAQAGFAELFQLEEARSSPLQISSTDIHQHRVRVFEVLEGQNVSLCLQEQQSVFQQRTSVDIFFVGKNAKLTLLDQRTRTHFEKSFAASLVIQEEQSEFKASYHLLGGGLNRYSLLVQQNGVDCKTQISDFRSGSEADHIDFRSILYHSFVRGWSRQTSHALLAGQSRGIFNGRVVIARDAQQVDLGQVCRSLLLSEAAEADAKPELEIFADNVKATHGATVGALDSESLFYLMSRGLSESRSKTLLCHSFAIESLANIGSTPLYRVGEQGLKNYLEKILTLGAS